MAQHATIQAAIDNAWVTTYQAKFVSVEDAWAATHGGNYWQGIITPATPPDDGATVNPDFTRHPTDQVADWDDVFTGPNALPSTNWAASIRVDVYDGPLGKGWTVSPVYTKGGETWTRTYNVGPETWREQSWSGGPVIQGLMMSDVPEFDVETYTGPWYKRLWDRTKRLWQWGRETYRAGRR